ncbi:hypothetical protein ACIU0H_02495 [Pseudomonas aeruginosa]
MKTTIKTLALTYLLLGTGAACSVELHSSDRGNLNFNLELTAAPLFSSFDYASGQPSNVTWLESYIRTGLSGAAPVWHGDLYGGIGIMTSKVLGEGDAAGTSKGNERRTSVDSAFLGWRNATLDLSAGRQGYTIGDGFLIAGDQLNYGERSGHGFNRGGLYYLAAPSTFAQSAIIRLRPSGVFLLEGFHVESDNHGQGSPHLSGLNVEFGAAPDNSLGLTYFTVDNVDTHRAEGLFQMRKALQVRHARAQSNLGIPGLALEVGYADERSSRVDSRAWYSGISYGLNDYPLQPVFGYRYSWFSGDNPGTHKSEAFDPLFYGSLVGDPGWVQGEIAGAFAGPFNSNAKVHRLSARVTLNERMAISAKGFRFDSERDAVHLADELDLYFETFPGRNFALIPVIGLWKPRQGAEAQYGQRGVQTFFTVIGSLTF